MDVSEVDIENTEKLVKPKLDSDFNTSDQPLPGSSPESTINTAFSNPVHSEQSDDTVESDNFDTSTKAEPSIENSKDDDNDGWIYVLGNSQLKKRTIKPGTDNSRPAKGQTVTVKCVGQLDNGTEIDKHDELKIVIGDDDFVQAFDLCIALMNKGELCEIMTDARFAYGEHGREPDVPPNSTILYKVELVNIEDESEFHTLTVNYRLQLSDEKRQRGNFLYSHGDFSRAVDVYAKAMKIVDTDEEPIVESPDELASLADMRIKCCNNLAAAQLKLEAWDAAIKSCDLVLLTQPTNVKAMFRKAKQRSRYAYRPLLALRSDSLYCLLGHILTFPSLARWLQCIAGKGDYDDAIAILTKAIKLEPDAKIIQQELSRLVKINREQNRSQKELYQKMMGTDKEPFINKTTSVKTKSVDRRWIWYVVGALASMIVPLVLTFYKYFYTELDYTLLPETSHDSPSESFPSTTQTS